MNKVAYLMIGTFLWFGPVKADAANLTPKYLDSIIRAYRALGFENNHSKAKTICDLSEKFRTALKTMGDKKTLIIPLDLQANVFLGVDGSEAMAFGQKLEETYATELKTCHK